MVEEFTKLLKDNKDDKNFEVHKSITDSTGKEKYFKVDKEEVATKTNLKAMATDVANEICDQNF